jgi:hypothetical protein
MTDYRDSSRTGSASIRSRIKFVFEQDVKTQLHLQLLHTSCTRFNRRPTCETTRRRFFDGDQ